MKRLWQGKRKGKEKGQSIIEVALILPVMLLILAGALDLGRLYYVTVALTDAAGEGANYAAINPHDSDGIVSRVQDASGGMVQIETEDIAVDCPVVSPGRAVTVTVSYDFTVATPIVNMIVPGGVLELRGVAAESILTGEM